MSDEWYIYGTRKRRRRSREVNKGEGWEGKKQTRKARKILDLDIQDGPNHPSV